MSRRSPSLRRDRCVRDPRPRGGCGSQRENASAAARRTRHRTRRSTAYESRPPATSPAIPASASFAERAGQRLECRQLATSDYSSCAGLRRGARARRHPVRGRRVREVPRVVRPVLGPREVDHEARARKPRVRDVRRGGLLPVLRRVQPAIRRRGTTASTSAAGTSIALNSNCSAVGGCGAGSPQEQWLRADLAAHPASMHARVLAPPALLVGRARQRLDVHGVLAGAVRRERGRRPRRARPRLRALRAADAERRARSASRHPRVRRRHGRQGGAAVLDGAGEQRGARRDEPRRARADARRGRVRVALPAGGRARSRTAARTRCH